MKEDFLFLSDAIGYKKPIPNFDNKSWNGLKDNQK